MARPKKQTAEYFSHDADMRNDIKVKAIRRKFQHKGYAVWCFMLEALTDSDDFEIEFGEVEQELLAADFDVPIEELKDIVEYCLKIGLFQQAGTRIYSEAHKRRFAEMVAAREKRRAYQEHRAEVNRINGRKGGNPNFRQGQPNPYYITETATEDNPEITENAEKITEDNPKIKESKVKENIEKSPKGDTKKTAQRFIPPTVEQVADYAKRKGYTSVDAQHFVDYYTSQGWRVGRNPMKDWEAAVRSWASRDRSSARATTGAQMTTTATGITLGVGETIRPDGKRTYGTSGVIVPATAPARPSAAHWWSEATQSWEKTI
jgi:hypothetical protein